MDNYKHSTQINASPPNEVFTKIDQHHKLNIKKLNLFSDQM